MRLSVTRPSSAGVCVGGGPPAWSAANVRRSADTASLSPVTNPSFVWHDWQWRANVIGWKPTRSAGGPGPPAAFLPGRLPPPPVGPLGADHQPPPGGRVALVAAKFR